MKKVASIYFLRMILILVLMLVLCACHNESASNKLDANRNDSLYTYKNIVKIHIEQPELALARIDTAQNKKLLSVDSCNLLRIVVLEAGKRRLEAEQIAEQYLETSKSDSLQPLYLWIKKCLVDDYMIDTQYDKCLKHALDGVRLAHEAKNLKVEVELNISAGNSMIRLNNMRGFDYFDQAIQKLENEGGNETLPTLSSIIGQKARQLANHSRYDEAAQTCEHRLQVIERLSHYTEIPNGYMDEQMGKTLCVKAYCLAKSKKYVEAQTTAEAFYKTAYSKTPNGYDDILSYEYEMNHGERIINICSKLYPLYFQEDTINANVVYFLSNFAHGYRLTKNYKEADRLMQRMTVINDSLHLREQRTETLELSEKYHTQEKEYLLAAEQLNLKITRIITIGVSVLLLIAVFALFIVSRYNNIILEKNHILVEQINEINSSVYKQPIKATKSASTEELNNKNSEDCVLHDKFLRLEKYMTEDKVFKNVDFCRDDILQLLNINRNQLAQIFSEYADGVTSPTYINSHRLRLACQIIRNNKDISMQLVSSECGFSTTRNFNRAFKQKYAITPLEYKNGLE